MFTQPAPSCLECQGCDPIGNAYFGERESNIEIGQHLITAEYRLQAREENTSRRHIYSGALILSTTIGRGAIKGLLPHYQQASYAIQGHPRMVASRYGCFLPQDKKALAAKISDHVRRRVGSAKPPTVVRPVAFETGDIE
ncbi:hypothetical protein IB270_33120 [Ensifer sp. ENS05]|uniref:hypothetical protein n=1 Tax=Ensifer sp. ENS05 TaxID=2769277 RepID=UPI00177B6D32|nr:hypothetical protein [Ensifer sp. ENS05]MBD9597669.1 hypothetical protein [Ensifer sp. ENS05]